MTRLYLDHNASSPLRPEAQRAMADALSGPRLGNPSSAHAEGRRARHLLEDARETIARLVGADRDDVVFTSGGTESNALAITAAPRDSTVLLSPLEHPSVLEPAAARCRVALLPVGPDGCPLDLEAAFDREHPALVSVAIANHEIGCVQDVGHIARSARAATTLTHTDASQALGRIPLDARALGVDMMTLSSHKLGGPVGVGALVVRNHAPLEPILRGGGQEAGWRSGTEPALLAHGFAAAAAAAVAELPEAASRWRAALEELLVSLRAVAPDVVVHSAPERGLPQTLNVSFPGHRGPSIVHRLDLAGVSVSHGSACATGSLEPSPVLLALGLGDDTARASIRISLGHGDSVSTTRAFVERLARVLAALPRRDAQENRGARETTNG